MKQIPLTHGKYAIVDDEDYEMLIKHKWSYSPVTGYASTSLRYGPKGARKGKTVNIQRMILGFPEGKDTDHINGDKLDNRQVNLRVCTHTENTRNRAKYAHNKSGYVGIHWHKVNRKWVAQIKVNQKVIYLGSFIDIKDAVKVRREAAMKYFGEYIRTGI